MFLKICLGAFSMNLANRLKELRQTHKVSQQELSDLLGVSTRAWRFYEASGREPNVAGLITLADYFNISLDYLVGRSDDPKRK
jgi:transcriptional regulator with XRE-family HTH domain